MTGNSSLYRQGQNVDHSHTEVKGLEDRIRLLGWNESIPFLRVASQRPKVI